MEKSQGWRRVRVGEESGLGMSQGWGRVRVGEESGLGKSRGWIRDGSRMDLPPHHEKKIAQGLPQKRRTRSGGAKVELPDSVFW